MALGSLRFRPLCAVLCIVTVITVRGLRTSSSNAELAASKLRPQMSLPGIFLPAFCSAWHARSLPSWRSGAGLSHANDLVQKPFVSHPARASTIDSAPASPGSDDLPVEPSVKPRPPVAPPPAELLAEASELLSEPSAETPVYFDFRERIGEGKDGDVWSGSVAPDLLFPSSDAGDIPIDVAVKIIKGTANGEADAAGHSTDVSKPRIKRSIKRAVYQQAIQLLSTENFLSTYKVWEGDAEEYVCMELADGDVGAMVFDRDFDQVTLFDRVRLFEDLLRGMYEMRLLGYAHTQLKPSNLLVVFDPTQERLRLKIGDLRSVARLFSISPELTFAPSPLDDKAAFWEAIADCMGGAVIDQEDNSIHIVDAPYLSPERAADQRLRRFRMLEKGDVFSAGIVWYQMLFRGYMPLAYYSADFDWKDFDIFQDPLYSTARELAQQNGQHWLLQLFYFLEMMLERDMDLRIDVQEAFHRVPFLSKWAPSVEGEQDAVEILEQVLQVASESCYADEGAYVTPPEEDGSQSSEY